MWKFSIRKVSLPQAAAGKLLMWGGGVVGGQGADFVVGEAADSRSDSLRGQGHEQGQLLSPASARVLLCRKPWMKEILSGNGCSSTDSPSLLPWLEECRVCISFFWRD